MDRRGFVTSLGGLVALVSLGGLAGLSTRAGNAPRVSAQLAAQLHDIADPRFADYAAGQQQHTLYSSLLDKGVISTRGLAYTELRELVQHEPLLAYKGFYYTQTELDLYALAYLTSQR